MMNKSIWTTTNPGHGSNHSNGADSNSLLVCTEHNKFTPYSSPTEILVRTKMVSSDPRSYLCRTSIPWWAGWYIDSERWPDFSFL